MSRSEPLTKTTRLIVYSSLFPSDATPTSGTFIRERMFRVGRLLPVVVVAPQAWSPFDWLARLIRPAFRPRAIPFEVVDGIEVHRPRWLSLPGIGKRFDGRLMAFFSRRCVERIHRTFKATVIDAHFLYPDGWAASRIARKLGLPLTITIRGSKDEWLIGTDRERFLVEAMQAATHLFAVSDALKRDVAVRLGVSEDKVSVVGNGVDLGKFHPVDKREARRRLGLDEHAKVLIGVGGLVPRKGFQRVIPLLAALRQRYPDLVYLIVGGETGDARMRVNLEALARRHGVEGMIRFCGAQPPAALKWFYGAADVFALATEHEGWANVFLEAMACGLPVVTTRVGGNAQVVADSTVGTIVDWWDAEAFRIALDAALSHDWDRDAIVSYARSNTWDNRVARLVEAFNRVVSQSGAAAP